MISDRLMGRAGVRREGLIRRAREVFDKMSETAREAATKKVEVSRLTISLLVAVPLMIGVWTYGVEFGNKNGHQEEAAKNAATVQQSTLDAVQQLTGKVDTLQQSISPLATAVADLRSKQESAEADRKRMEREFRLFYDQVWGRVARMPYRPPQTPFPPKEDEP